MKKGGYYKGLFLVSAIYDLILGLIFTFFYKPVFNLLGIPLPAFGGYLSLIGVFLIVLGVGYYYLSRGDLVKNRDLLKVGILYKFAYALVAFFYLAAGTIPHVIFAWVFGVIDLIFAILFIECLSYTKRKR
jgi:hypothetical protein